MKSATLKRLFLPMITVCVVAKAASAFRQGGRLPPSFRSVTRRHSRVSLVALHSQSNRSTHHTGTSRNINVNANANAPSFSSPRSLPESKSKLSPESTPQFHQLQLETLQRILLPSLLASLASTLLFPPLALSLSYLINDAATFAVLSVDSSQFVQNFLTVTGLTFSILVGQTYYFMYQQQESVFNSLFGEVTEAKSLLEQVALACQGREEMYRVCLGAIQR